ncbi:MAG: HAD family hydrolase [Dehalococcoidia bacterium]
MDTVFLLDVDNTLLDNDGVKAHLQGETRAALGETGDRRFWDLYEQVRQELDVVSVPVTIERMRREWPEPEAIDRLATRLYGTPFSSFVFPGALELLRELRHEGLPVILSDGDSWYQAKKITDAGFGGAVGGNVLIYAHKETHIDVIRHWYPADRDIAVDDKARLLGLLKQGFGEVLTTIWIRQGHYAQGAREGNLPTPDYTVDDLAGVSAAIKKMMARPVVP